ncbi:ABC transporter substrate-binding protein [Bradyrhizobium sp.]|uniref:ABC transporter substrate-binding protein n=1 Tax=Bradyrhizobium sp. TaxID=376 RepID=UPI0039E70B93
MSVKVGIHPQSPAGPVLLRSPAFAGVRDALRDKVEWVYYGHGTQTPRHFAEGTIDVGLTGATPPITIQSAGHGITYLAVGQPRPNSGAIVVPIESQLHSLEDLAGKRIGFAVGSWHTAFVALTLDRVGRSYSDIVPVNFVDTQGRADRSTVDAWVARPEEIEDPSVRSLVRVGEIWSNRSVIFSRSDVSKRAPETLARVVAALDAAGRWLGENPAEAAALLEEGSPVGRDALERGIRRQTGAEGLSPADAAFAAEQQRVADVLAQAKFLEPVRIADSVNQLSLAIWNRAHADAVEITRIRQAQPA